MLRKSPKLRFPKRGLNVVGSEIAVGFWCERMVQRGCSAVPFIGAMFVGALFIGSLLGGQAVADQWTQFRGNRMDGRADSAHPNRWSETENVRWSIEVPGEGWSCPILWNDQLFVTAAVPVVSEASQSATQPEEYQGGGGSRRDDLTQLTYRWQVICLDPQTGNERWRQTAREGRPSIPRHSSNTYATETPITDGERVYAYFGMTGLY